MSHGLYFILSRNTHCSIESKDQTVALCPAGRKREKLTQIEANVEGCLQNLQMQYDDVWCGIHIQCGLYKSLQKLWGRHHFWYSRKICVWAMSGMKCVPLTTIFPSVRNRSKSSNNTKQRSTTYEIKHVFLFEEHRKACIDAKTHYCSTICAGNQKGNKNIQKPSKPGFCGFSMKQATQLSDAIRMLTVNNSSVQHFRLAGIQLWICPLHRIGKTTEI